ncbi:hypothetical protein [Virgibacillus salexigens]|uniref:hypothetical protein n=1 Tax=Virgibacillus salexigens TaxID=61016 RepID=UPI00190D4AC1|nr:hypothetical protein [Virgibacillus salexigens]
MEYINGLYVSLVLMMVIILLNTTIFNDEYSGIAMFISLGVFIFGTVLFINAKRIKSSRKE